MATKRNKTQQVDEVRELAPEQALCIAALLEGLSDQEAAERAGVSRSSVQRWKASDALFCAELNKALQEQFAESTARLRAARSEAAAVVLAALKSDDERTRLAVAWKLLDSDFLPMPKGSTTPAGVRAAWDGSLLFAFEV